MHGKVILLMDDPVLKRALDNPFFRRGGFRLLAAAGGEEAFGLVEEMDPALAVFRFSREGFDGGSCCRRVKDDPLLRSTPVLLIASSDLEEDLELCRGAGCDEVLPASFDSADLLNAACRLLNIVERVAPRFDVEFTLLCGKTSKKLYPGKAINLNIGGVFLGSEHLYPVDTLVNLKFDLPGRSESVVCRGRVAWVNHPEWVKKPHHPPGMGVAFEALEEEEVAAIEAYLQSRAAEER